MLTLTLLAITQMVPKPITIDLSSEIDRARLVAEVELVHVRRPGLEPREHDRGSVRFVVTDDPSRVHVGFDSLATGSREIEVAPPSFGSMRALEALNDRIERGETALWVVVAEDGEARVFGERNTSVEQDSYRVWSYCDVNDVVIVRGDERLRVVGDTVDRARQVTVSHRGLLDCLAARRAPWLRAVAQEITTPAAHRLDLDEFERLVADLGSRDAAVARRAERALKLRGRGRVDELRAAIQNNHDDALDARLRRILAHHATAAIARDTARAVRRAGRTAEIAILVEAEPLVVEPRIHRALVARVRAWADGESIHAETEAELFARVRGELGW